jgi:isochorismate synthase
MREAGTRTASTIATHPCRKALREGLSRARALDRPVVVAHREQLRDTPDLLELFAAAEARGQRRFLASRPQDGFALLGLGVTSEIVSLAAEPFADVSERARVLLHEADAGALLLGGFAFAPRALADRDPAWRSRANARFTLPALLLTRRASEAWLTRITRVHPADDEEELARRSQTRAIALLEKARPERADRVHLQASRDPGQTQLYLDAAAELIAAIQRGEAEKVVLARVERLRLTGALPTVSVLRRLWESHPTAFIYADGIAHETFLGATPEGLIRRTGAELVASAVAGTVARGDTKPATARLASKLRRSPKERAEHGFVVRAIEEALSGLCRELEVPREPRPVDTGTLQHLHTLIRGQLLRPTHVLELVSRLHPTPAVGGTPTSRALELIRKHEHFDRGGYAGPIGYFDASGDGEFVVALRCGLFCHDEVRLFAGAGLVAESHPESEAAETLLKFRTLRAALEAACNG